MAKKVIHIWVHDAGFDESQVKRDAGGQFATQAASHAHKANSHKAAWESKGVEHPESEHHTIAYSHHRNAAEEFGKAAKAHGAGNLEQAQHNATRGAMYAKEAEMAESKLPKAAPLPDSLASGLLKQANGTLPKTPPKPQPQKINPLTGRPLPNGFNPGQKEMEAHPQYTKEDHEYLKGKGWSNSEIHQRWDAEHKAGQARARGKGQVPDVVGVVANPNFYKKATGAYQSLDIAGTHRALKAAGVNTSHITGKQPLVQQRKMLEDLAQKHDINPPRR